MISANIAYPKGNVRFVLSFYPHSYPQLYTGYPQFVHNYPAFFR
ncbi:hypothetical protein SAMN05421852_101431 [Thermoflavimicrobium dichotomicum]|uniref:Uncharacterized protein n=1 Tax=Thermoflavimicrobium dichotomicum TaxID=46223 RepID=A0A1I3KF22_9BACL|nr:hypothetical protein SAMN05421852_101431 [Thermoflavimicrobium dichotomicum]